MTEEPSDTDKSPVRDSINAIGELISIIGDVSGKEDIVVNGHIEGNLNFLKFSVVIGKNGRVNADIAAREIVIEGEVKGDLHASELIKIKPSGKVTGNIRALQVVLSQGCQFKGSVDMAETHTHNTGDSRNPKPKLTDSKRPISRTIGNTAKKPVGIRQSTFPPLKKEDS